MLLLLLSLASAYPPSSIPFEDALEPPSARYDGEFVRPPVHHWSVELPGRTLNSATHSERSPVAISDEYLLVGSAGGDGLYVMSRRNGALLRKLPAKAAVQAEAAVVDERVYFADIGGNTWCYKLDGTKVWSHDSKAPILVRPTVTDGRVYVTNVDDLAVALDSDSGELIWRYQAKRDVSREADLTLYDAPPAIMVDEDVLLGFSDGTLVSVNAETGDEQWTRRVGEGRYPDLVGAPVPYGSDIYASGYFMPLVAIDKKTHNVRWRMDVGGASALVVNDKVDPVVAYHPGTDGKLRAIAVLTGAETWVWDSKTDGALTEPLITGAGLLVASSSGNLYLVNPENGKKIWEYHEEKLLSGVTARPTVAGRQLLFVTNSGRLHSMLSPRQLFKAKNHHLDAQRQGQELVEPGEPRSPSP